MSDPVNKQAQTHSASLFPFAVLSASYYGHIGFFNPYLPLWLKSLGLPLFTISLLTSVQAATRLFAPYGWGWLSDHTGERVKLLRYSASVAFVCAAGLLWIDRVTPLGWLVAVLFLMFTHTSSMTTMSEAAMAHLVTQSTGSLDMRVYGRVRVWGSIGFLVTVFAAGAWFDGFGIGDFPAWAMLTLATVVVSVWLLPDVKEQIVHHENNASVGEVLIKPEVRWFFAELFFHVISHMSIYIFLSLYMDSLGYGKTMIGVMWALSVIAEIIWFFGQGRWLPKFSLRTWLLICASLTLLRMVLMASFAQWLWVLVVAQTLHAITFATHHASCIGLVSHYFPGRTRARGQALFTVIGYGFTGVIAGFAGGWLSTHWGLHSVFWASCVTALLAVGCALRLRSFTAASH